MNKQRFPDGWDEDRVHRVLDHYHNQSEEDAVVEDEAAFEKPQSPIPTSPDRDHPREAN